MHFHGVNIPEDLISAAYTGSLVVFAGAGVSMQKPVCFPSFNSLVTRIKDQVDPAGDTEIDVRRRFLTTKLYIQRRQNNI